MIDFIKKPISIILIIIVFVFIVAGYFYFSREKNQEFDVVIAQRGELVQEVGVTGRIRPVRSVELAFEKSGKVERVFVEVNQKVGADQILARLDSESAEKDFRDAEINLKNARLILDKLKLSQTQDLRGDVLNKNYEDGLIVLDKMYSGFAEALNSLDKIFFGENLEVGRNNISYYSGYDDRFATAPQNVRRLYEEIKVLYLKGLADYQLATRGVGDIRRQAVESGYALASKTAELIKSGYDPVRFMSDAFVALKLVHVHKSIIDNHANDLSSRAAVINDSLSSLIVISSAINKEFDKLPVSSLDIKTQELVVKQRENDLRDAQNRLADYYIKAPISGIVTSVNAKTGEIISAGVSAISLVSKSQFEIEANVPEADIAKVKIGDPAKVTLDAYGENIIFAAKVVKIDFMAEFLEGVANYKTKLEFIEKDERIRAGMTADIDILTAKKEKAILLPQRAIIFSKGLEIVRILRKNGAVEEVEVKTGITGKRGEIEILSGVEEGDSVIKGINN